MSEIALLRQDQPDWFSADNRDTASLVGEATILAPGAAQDWRVQLLIVARNGEVHVGPIGTEELPKSCPQRHINEDGSFCIGFRAGHDISTCDRAVVWWGLLYRYLELQRVAARTGRWPARQALSHGIAGAHQLEAQSAAKRLGVLDRYMDMLDGQEFWLSNRRLILNKKGDGVINGRAACPVGCRRGKKPRLRRECCRKADVIALVGHERMRKTEEYNYWIEQKRSGANCCASMSICPLKGQTPKCV